MNLDELLDALNQEKQNLAFAQNVLGTGEIELGNLKKIRELIEERLAEAARAERDKRMEIDRARQTRKSASSRIESLQQQISVQRAKELAAEKLLAQATEFDRLTASAYWREWAKDYQLHGARFLASASRGINADDMGLGKTITTIAACDMVKAKRILFVCPNGTVKNAIREWHLWAPHRRNVIQLAGMAPLARNLVLPELAKAEAGDFVCVINYEAWRRDDELIDALKLLRFDTVMIDEAHHIKDSSSNAYEGIDRIIYEPNVCPNCDGSKFRYLKHPARYMCETCLTDTGVGDITSLYRSVVNVWPMTGTPILNKPQELFALLALINNIIFYSERVFLSTYCVRVGPRWKFKPGGESQLLKEIGGFFLRRERADIGDDLPPQTVEVHELKLTPNNYPNQYAAYRNLTDLMAIAVNTGEVKKITEAIVLITRQRQMTTWPNGIKWLDPETKAVMFDCAVTESIKIDTAVDLVTEKVSNGARSVVFSSFKDGLHELKRRFDAAGIPAAVYDGTTSASMREQIELDFDRRHTANGEHRWDVLLINSKVGSEGINLTGATHTVLVDEPFHDAGENQILHRTYRTGQTESTEVDILRVADSIDTWIGWLINFKANMKKGFIDESVDITAEFVKALSNGFQ